MPTPFDKVIAPAVSSDTVKSTTTAKDYGYGLRKDKTKKGRGYFGPIARKGGQVSTELSLGVGFDGKEVEIPSMVPTLDAKEMAHILSGKKPTKQIVGKAIEHAKKRKKLKKSPFADDTDPIIPLPRRK